MAGMAPAAVQTDKILSVIKGTSKPIKRPFITLSYAQSLDGSIAANPGEQYILSDEAAARFTHQLRAQHDGILIGIGTVLADDPQLTVRHVDGKNPQPVILDSQLRTPLEAGILQSQKPWIASTSRVDSQKQTELAERGIRVLNIPPDSVGQVSLPDLMVQLDRDGIKTLMVEGGARVITSFLSQRLVDLLVITIAPLFLGGLPSIAMPLSNAGSISGGGIGIKDWSVMEMGIDLIVWGFPEYPEHN